jgi:hypothetical protein
LARDRELQGKSQQLGELRGASGPRRTTKADIIIQIYTNLRNASYNYVAAFRARLGYSGTTLHLR